MDVTNWDIPEVCMVSIGDDNVMNLKMPEISVMEDCFITVHTLCVIIFVIHTLCVCVCTSHEYSPLI